ncbi:MAG TPA: hypothetical protein VMW42_01475 [Desulfatiglandales bacterium]|nr:hypothetical protein [Desulfatiglandales bacterium]
MYSPKISDAHIPALYHMAKERGWTMTKLVNCIISQEIDNQHRNKLKGGAYDCLKGKSRVELPD